MLFCLWSLYITIMGTWHRSWKWIPERNNSWGITRMLATTPLLSWQQVKNTRTPTPFPPRERQLFGRERSLFVISDVKPKPKMMALLSLKRSWDFFFFSETFLTGSDWFITVTGDFAFAKVTKLEIPTDTAGESLVKREYKKKWNRVFSKKKKITQRDSRSNLNKAV